MAEREPRRSRGSQGRQDRRGGADRGRPGEVRVPALGLVVLVGVSGSGKSTFAARHFSPWEVVSSDQCRGLVANDPDDQAATADAFDLLGHLVGLRLRRGLLTVVDATSVQRTARQQLVRLAKEHDVLVDAVVLQVPERVAVDRNAARPDRAFGAHVVRRQQRELERSLRGLRKEGFRRVHVLDGVEAIDAASIVREPSWNDRRDLTGPVDVIGDVHGCASELTTLLGRLGYVLLHDAQGRPAGASHPGGRTAVFVGDLVDRGPDTPGVLRLVMGMVASGDALCVAGNHEAKLVRALQGADVRPTHGLDRSLEQLAAEPEGFRADALAFMDRLVSHYVLDGGRLVVAHAGLKEAYHGRSSGRVRSFALYGDTTGETDELGLPVRLPWARDYRGEAAVVYGHTPVSRAEWVNRTLCLDTGVVFGGELTALRWPERELVAVPAEREWYAPARPLAPPAGAGPDAGREPDVLALTDVVDPAGGPSWLETDHLGRVKIPAENAVAALEVMSRFAVDPRWLVHLPATMSPAGGSGGGRDGLLEHPEQAFEDYAAMGVTRVVCEEKHMGSRAVAVLTRDADVAARRFGVADGSTGMVHTRTGRAFLDDPVALERLVGRLREAAAPLFEELGTDWLVLDGELMPWSAKALGLIKEQYAAVGAVATHALLALAQALSLAAARGLDVADLAERTDRRLAHARAFRDVYAAYCAPSPADPPAGGPAGGPADPVDGLSYAPFQVLAAEGRVLAAAEPHPWHLARLAAMRGDLVVPTRHVAVDLASREDRDAATAWWEELTAAGGEGMVVKPVVEAGDGPADEPGDGARGGRTARRLQPGLKVRGRDYLRLVYGPDYTDSLDVLRSRDLSRKRGLALREHGLGLESLTRFVAGEPLWRVHEVVFAVLALESEPVDPRL